MTDIRDANPHTDGFEPRPGIRPFGMHPDDVPYAGDDYCDLSDFDDRPELLAAGDPEDAPSRPPLPLEPAERAALAQAIHAGLREHGCDNTLRAARAWARRATVRWGWLRAVLEDRGGFCDCEVVLNVLEEPD
jgi:Protein of unknown function (DUF2695)